MILIKTVMGAEFQMNFDDEQAEILLATDSRFRKLTAAEQKEVKQAEAAEKPVRKTKKGKEILETNPAWEQPADEQTEESEGE
jgi:hypothetical protein